MRASARFIGLSVAAGCLVGAVVPLPHRGGSATISTPRHGSASMKAGAGDEAIDLNGVTAADAAAAASTDPHKFFHRLLKADPQPSREIMEAFFTAWIERNPDAAFQADLQLPARFRCDAFFPRQVQLLFRRDPEKALRWMGRIDGVIGGDMVLHTWGDLDEKLRQLNPEEVGAWLNRTPRGGVSVTIAKTFAEVLARQDPAAAVRWAESLSVAYQNAVMPMIINRFSKKYPAAAMEYIRNAPSNIRQHGVLFAMEAQSAANVLEQMKWLDEEMGVTSYTGISNLMMMLYKSEKQLAMNHVVSLEGTTQGIDAARGLAEAACLHGPTPDALAVIARLPDSMQADAARAAMLFRMPGDFPAFLGPLADGSIKGANLDAYTELLAAFVDGEKGTSFGQQRFTWTVASVPEHLEAFQKWIENNPGPQRDRFIRQSVDVLRDNPDLKGKAFGNLPREEMERIMAGQ